MRSLQIVAELYRGDSFCAVRQRKVDPEIWRTIPRQQLMTLFTLMTSSRCTVVEREQRRRNSSRESGTGVRDSHDGQVYAVVSLGTRRDSN